MSTINPLYIAADGYLKEENPSLMPAVNGYWFTSDGTLIAPLEEIRKRSSSKSKTYGDLPRYENVKDEKFDYRLYTEEEEIMLLIKIFLRCQ